MNLSLLAAAALQLGLLAAPQAGSPAADKPLAVPASMVIDGVPDVPMAIAEKARPYSLVRSASFQAFAADGAGVYLLTRFGETAQVHHVVAPAMDREQLTFQKEPASAVRVDPAAPGGFYYSADSGGGEFYQVYWFDLGTGRPTRMTDGKSRNEGLMVSHQGHLAGLLQHGAHWQGLRLLHAQGPRLVDPPPSEGARGPVAALRLVAGWDARAARALHLGQRAAALRPGPGERRAHAGRAARGRGEGRVPRGGLQLEGLSAAGVGPGRRISAALPGHLGRRQGRARAGQHPVGHPGGGRQPRPHHPGADGERGRRGRSLRRPDQRAWKGGQGVSAHRCAGRARLRRQGQAAGLHGVGLTDAERRLHGGRGHAQGDALDCQRGGRPQPQHLRGSGAHRVQDLRQQDDPSLHLPAEDGERGAPGAGGHQHPRRARGPGRRVLLGQRATARQRAGRGGGLPQRARLGWLREKLPEAGTMGSCARTR